jgi:multidrug efflux pump subunit AcrB
MSLTRLSVDNPVVVGILAAILIAAGFLAAFSLGIVFLPDITSPTVVVDATYRGADVAAFAVTERAPLAGAK